MFNKEFNILCGPKEYIVLEQQEHQYLNTVVRISKVLDTRTLELYRDRAVMNYAYICEEVSNNTHQVVATRYINEEMTRKNYYWYQF